MRLLFKNSRTEIIETAGRGCSRRGWLDGWRRGLPRFVATTLIAFRTTLIARTVWSWTTIITGTISTSRAARPIAGVASRSGRGLGGAAFVSWRTLTGRCSILGTRTFVSTTAATSTTASTTTISAITTLRTRPFAFGSRGIAVWYLFPFPILEHVPVGILASAPRLSASARVRSPFSRRFTTHGWEDFRITFFIIIFFFFALVGIDARCEGLRSEGQPIVVVSGQRQTFRVEIFRKRQTSVFRFQIGVGGQRQSRVVGDIHVFGDTEPKRLVFANAGFDHSLR